MNTKIDTRLIIFGAIGIIVLIFALIFLGVIPGLKKNDPAAKTPTGTLSVWVINDFPDAYDTALRKYKEIYPGINVLVKTFPNESLYSTNLLNALAAGEGPDVFMVDNASILKNANKIEPLPKERITIPQLRSLFPRVVENDFVSADGTIFGLPLSIDTLVMLYNKDIFDTKGIAEVPKTWEEFKTLIPKLVSIEGTKKIITAAAAIGGSEKNIDHASDLLQLILMQSGTQMLQINPTAATFSRGADGLRFYMAFSDPRTDGYTWNASMPFSLDAFANGTTAIIFDYANVIKKIKEKNQWINIGIAPVPYPAQAVCKNEYECRVAYARYYGYTVSRQSKLKGPAWDFVLLLTTEPNATKDYMLKTNNPPALRSLISQVAGNPDLEVQARQALIARSWQQPNRARVSEIFSTMIETLLDGRGSIEISLKQAEDAVNQLIKDQEL